MEEFTSLIEQFADSGWDLISEPAKAWLAGRESTEALLQAVEEADMECGSCGCDLDPLYKRCLELGAEL